MANGQDDKNDDMPDFSDVQKQAEGQPTAYVPAIILLLLKWGFLVLLIAFLIFLLSRALVRFWQGKDLESAEDEHETLFSWALLRSDLGAFWAWLFARWRRKKPAGPAAPPAAKPPAAAESEQDYDVRELYRALLWQGSQIGLTRKSSETPYEYEKRVESSFPDSRGELAPLTESYIRARYGEEKQAPEKIALLNRIWRSLRQKLVRQS